MDPTHNPEFTTCEFYWAYADVHDLMDMTEDMFSKMVYSIHGSYVTRYHPEGVEGENKNKVIEIDWSTPWRRMPMMQSLREHELLKHPDFPADDELDTDKARKFFDDLCKK